MVNVWLAHSLDMHEHLLIPLQTRISTADYFCIELKFDSLTLRKVQWARSGLAVLTVKFGVEVGVSSLICHSVLAFAGTDGVISVDVLSRTEPKFVLLFVV